MPDKILIATLPNAAGLSAVEAASALTRTIRSHDRDLQGDQIVQLPLVDGGEGTIDFLVTHSLGSFLEVDATNAAGEQAIVPIGFAGEDGNLGVIEIRRLAGVDRASERGTTFGIGELIQDSLDEGAFSILLGHEEPIARDAGLGIAAALGVKFLDETGSTLDMSKQDAGLEKIAKIDSSGRSFQLLSSRFFVARSASQAPRSVDPLFLTELTRIAAIVKRDVGVDVSLEDLSPSGIEFGLRAFLNATIGEGTQLVLEASGIESRIKEDFRAVILFAEDPSQLNATGIERFVRSVMAGNAALTLLFTRSVSDEARTVLRERFGEIAIESLADAPLFQAPLSSNAGFAEIRRDILMRLEKSVPKHYDRMLSKNGEKNARAKREAV